MNSDSAAIAELVREARTDVSCRQLSRPSAVPAVEVNKRFLESTIRTVEDHNRREVGSSAIVCVSVQSLIMASRRSTLAGG